MSKESAKKFLEKVEKDAHFRELLQKAKGTSEAQKIIEANHFQFSEKDYADAYKEKYHRALTDAELKKIAAAGSANIITGDGLKVSLWLKATEE